MDDTSPISMILKHVVKMNVLSILSYAYNRRTASVSKIFKMKKFNFLN